MCLKLYEKSELLFFSRKSKNRVEKIINYIETSSAFDYPGGVPTSMVKSGQQWDFSNAWAPLQGMNFFTPVLRPRGSQQLIYNFGYKGRICT